MGVKARVATISRFKVKFERKSSFRGQRIDTGPRRIQNQRFVFLSFSD